MLGGEREAYPEQATLFPRTSRLWRELLVIAPPTVHQRSQKQKLPRTHPLGDGSVAHI